VPTYEYRCAKCDEHLEVYQSFSEAPLTKHQGCGGKLTKVLSPAGIVLKGSGFYKTDSRSGSRSKTAKTEKKEKSETGASTDGKKESSTSSSPESSGSSGSSGGEAKSA
jgi:putative FmdB family regulatory protein